MPMLTLIAYSAAAQLPVFFEQLPDLERGWRPTSSTTPYE